MPSTSAQKAINLLQTIAKSPWPSMLEAIEMFISEGILDVPPAPQWSEDKEALFVILAGQALGHYGSVWRDDETPVQMLHGPPRIFRSNFAGSDHSWAGRSYDKDGSFEKFMIDTFGREALITKHPALREAKCPLSAWLAPGFGQRSDNLHTVEPWIHLLPWSDIEAAMPWPNTPPIRTLLLAASRNRGDKHHIARMDNLLSVAIANGAKLTGSMPDSEGGPPHPDVMLLGSPQHWQVFIDQGGDPDTLVSASHRGDDVKVPVWQAKILHGYDELADAVTAWARAHRKEQLEKFEDWRYWKELKSITKYGSSSIDTLRRALRSDPQWHKRRDDQGRTPMMVAFHSHASIVADMDRKKFAADLLARDNKGRTLAHYLLTENMADASQPVKLKVDQSAAFTLMGNHPGMLDVMPDGRGILDFVHHNKLWLLAPTVQAASSSPGFFKTSLKSGARELVAKTRPEAWLASPDDAYINELLSLPPSQPKLAILHQIAVSHPIDRWSPEQKIKDLLLLAAATNGTDNEAQLSAMIAAGARLPILPKSSEKAWLSEIDQGLVARLIADQDKKELLAVDADRLARPSKKSAL